MVQILSLRTEDKDIIVSIVSTETMIARKLTTHKALLTTGYHIFIGSIRIGTMAKIKTDTEIYTLKAMNTVVHNGTYEDCISVLVDKLTGEDIIDTLTYDEES